MTKRINIPWIEKYRPRNIDDIVIDVRTKKKIKQIIKEKSMPNLIITGSPGIGKTTTIQCIAHNLLGKYYKEGVKELNASNDRGVKAVEDIIKNFCKKQLLLQSEDNDNGQYANHKIIFLDEGDNMTIKAQQLINSLMENYPNTRFAFTCNNSSDIIEAIQSRCIIFRYIKLSKKLIKKKLVEICKKENVIYDKAGIDTLIFISQGDMRKAINNLQLTHNGYGKITDKAVYKLCNKPHHLVIRDIFLACNDRNLCSAITHLKKLEKGGYSSSDISLGLFETIELIDMPEITEDKKIKYASEISRSIIKIGRVDSSLQLSGCIAKLCSI